MRARNEPICDKYTKKRDGFLKDPPPFLKIRNTNSSKGFRLSLPQELPR